MNHTNLSFHMKTLGVSWNADRTEVKRAWRAAVKVSHPDVAGPSGHDKMVHINAAYRALKNGAPKPYEVSTPPVRNASTSPVSEGFNMRTDPGSYRIKPQRYQIPETIQGRLRSIYLADKPALKPTMKDRLLGRRTNKPRLHMPFEVTARNATVYFKFKMDKVHEGDHIILPVFAVEDHLLKFANAVNSHVVLKDLPFLPLTKIETNNNTTIRGYQGVVVYIGTGNYKP